MWGRCGGARERMTRGRGWQGALRGLACAGWLLLPAAGNAQTEVRKTLPPERSLAPGEVRNEVAVPPAPPPAGSAQPAWSHEVKDRALAAIGAEIDGDETRTRFSLMLSGNATYQYFLL